MRWGEDHQIAVSTLPGWIDPDVAIASSRAGAIGILNLEAPCPAELARAALAKLARYSKGECGVKLDSRSFDFAQPIVKALPSEIGWVIVTAGEPEPTRALVLAARACQKTVYLEAISSEEAELGVEAGVKGLIAKGNEAGGRVGEETTFILLQRFLSEFELPVWAHGGIGLGTAAACFAGGASGVVLDGQMALSRESSLPDGVKSLLEIMEGDETSCLDSESGDRYRVYRPRRGRLQNLSMEKADEAPGGKRSGNLWREASMSRMGWELPETDLLPLGQDAAFAARLARSYRTAGGIVTAIKESVERHIRLAQIHRPLDRGSPLALSHGTTYPILQGPMTRVSDVAAFAAAVADGGGLPFLALALLRGPKVRALLEETRTLLGDSPWGVGILGFVPPDVRQEQLEVVRAFPPHYALIAGGRPDQAASLEKVGIRTYLHVPSPGLLRLFLEEGARRFVFEGRECGGHVGPRSSFVLWESVNEVLQRALMEGVPAEELHVVYAGGIHDARSAAMVATLSAPLAERGVRVGVLMGTGYLFTEEAVRSGAIVPDFQKVAVECSRTVLLESGPGHATRCAKTPFFGSFQDTRKRLATQESSPQVMRDTLEKLNLGRLRIASKGIGRNGSETDTDSPQYVPVSPEQQRREGMYMMGQLAGLRGRTCRVAELHEDVAVGSSRLLEELSTGHDTSHRPEIVGGRPSEVAIVGMGCLLPQADISTFWSNILGKKDAIREVPKERWNSDRYFDADRKARDRIYSKWGGFLEDVAFDPMEYGIPPSSLPSIDPLQLLTLVVVRQALQDAGYLDGGLPRDRTSVILGVGGGLGDLGLHYGMRSSLPQFMGEVGAQFLERLPEWTEDSFSGVLLNVAAGRVAHCFDFKGVNFTVDAACASSLAAIHLAKRELDSGTSDVVIAGGVDTVQSPFAYLCFSKTQALSPRGRCRTFDETTDGIVISEGLAVVVLKRLVDAERDGDRIYAVIKSVAGSSDGRDRGLTAPRAEGQMRALERAYAQAGVSPRTVGLVEAHGTGTVAGDVAEVTALSRVFASAGASPRSCALGSVKSMIGHTKSTAGVAGLIKVALSLHHKTLPPTLHVQKPNAKLMETTCPFFVNSEPMPWFRGSPEVPRRAGVSAFGFGGTNFHAVLEEYDGADGGSPKAGLLRWPSELFFWDTGSPRELLESLKSLQGSLESGRAQALAELAASVCRRELWEGGMPSGERTRLAIVARSQEDLLLKVRTAREAIQAGSPHNLSESEGIYLAGPEKDHGKVAFLFPGLGSQYPWMFRELSLYFSEIREVGQRADRTLRDNLPRRLSSYIYPPPAFTAEEEREYAQALVDTLVAGPALAMVEMALYRLLDRLGVKPDMAAGHGYGEVVALCAAGVYSEQALFSVSQARGRFIKETAGKEAGGMLTVSASGDAVGQVLESLSGAWLASINGPRETVVAGREEDLNRAARLLEEQGLAVRRIPASEALPTPFLEPARERLATLVSSKEIRDPEFDVYSSTLAEPYPKDPGQIARTLSNNLVSPLRFMQQIEAMYEAGARTFIEVGPKTVLTDLTREILAHQDALVIPLDAKGQNGLEQLLHVLGQLAVRGLALDWAVLLRDRRAQRVHPEREIEAKRTTKSDSQIWWVNGGQVRASSSPSQKQTDKNMHPIHQSEKQVPMSSVSTPFASKSNAASAEAIGGSTFSDVPGDGNRRGQPGNGTGGVNGPVRQSFAPPVRPGLAPASTGLEQVMLSFQQLMSQFLQTQAAVMTAYLGGGASPIVQKEPLAWVQGEDGAFSKSLVAAPPDVRSPNPADSWGSRGGPPAAETPGPRPQTAGPSDGEVVTTKGEPGNGNVIGQLLEVVSDRTGYPPEMLDLDLNIEADLGIDSIKRVEILGAYQKHCSSADQQKLRGLMDKLTGAKTLREMSDLLAVA